MIKIENVEVVGWEAAIRGMRNPKNSWDKSDTVFALHGNHEKERFEISAEIGPNDLKLMKNLAKGGPVHAKYRRMLVVYADITCHHTWWAEFDTYKVGTVRNSCSKMHKIHVKEFVPEDFSHEGIEECGGRTSKIFKIVIQELERLRKLFNETQDRKYWRALIELLPMGFNIKATVMMSYEVLTNIYTWRDPHKVVEWPEFCRWIETLPYSEIITGKRENTKC
jgi:hypothetical protein